MSTELTNQLSLSGALPIDKTTIMCKNQDIALYLQSKLHNESSHVPPIVVSDQWSELWSCEAIAVVPIKILGATTPNTNFRVLVDLSENARLCYDAAMRISMSGGVVSFRNLCAAMYGLSKQTTSTRRQVDYMVRELVKKGLMRRVSGRLELTTGRWKPDAATAKANGVPIEVIK